MSDDFIQLPKVNPLFFSAQHTGNKLEEIPSVLSLEEKPKKRRRKNNELITSYRRITLGILLARFNWGTGALTCALPR